MNMKKTTLSTNQKFIYSLFVLVALISFIIGFLNLNVGLYDFKYFSLFALLLVILHLLIDIYKELKTFKR